MIDHTLRFGNRGSLWPTLVQKSCFKLPKPLLICGVERKRVSPLERIVVLLGRRQVQLVISNYLS